MTPAVAVEQKKQAVASPLSTPSDLSNKDGVRMNRRCGRQSATWVPPVEEKHGRDMQSPSDPSGAQVIQIQAE